MIRWFPAFRPVAFAILFILSVAVPNTWGSAGPAPSPMPPTIQAPRDVPYPGTISLQVNLTNTVHRVIAVQESIPVSPGNLTLLYPEWIPGDHAPTGPIQRIAGLRLTGGGKTLPWVRDSVDMYAFHVDVPQNVNQLQVDFDFLSAVASGMGRVGFSPRIVDLRWNEVVLYPTGYFSRQITISPSVVLPEGWKYATALTTVSRQINTIHFRETTLNTLVDSPLAAGENFERIDLSPSASNRVWLDVFAEEPEDLNIAPQELDDHKNLIVQARRLFRSRHYSHYDFLLMLSNRLTGEGLEHHQSSEDITEADYFSNWPAQVPKDDLLSHEYVHSWNGKFRRPADLWTPNFNVPMRNSLVWVYEGLTEYWGYVLAARSGMRSPEDTRDLLAAIAAAYEVSPGRRWRTLEDTTDQPILSHDGRVIWGSWERQESYYMEGVLIWLDVDTKIRELSHGRRSLDDFARLFYGVNNGSIITDTYNLQQLVEALNLIQPYDWNGFLRRKVYEIAPEVPLEGLTHGGYRLVFNDSMPLWEKYAKSHYDPGQNVASLGFTGEGAFDTSVGFRLSPKGVLTNVWWESPAFLAGLNPGTTLIAVNGEPFTLQRLQNAIRDAEKSPEPIRLLVSDNGQGKTFRLNYHGGLRYPHLERIVNKPDLLDTILSPLSRPAVPRNHRATQGL